MKKNKLKCGIYKIENITNNECYIGQSINIPRRKYIHFSNLRNNKSPHKKLQKAWNKYGEENFIFKILLYCDKEYLTYFEQKCVDTFDAKYNSLIECVDSPKGICKSQETIENMKKAQMNRYLKLYRKKISIIS